MLLPKVVLAACALLLMDRAAFAQMTPLTDERELVTNLRYDGRSGHDEKSPPGAFAPWFEFSGVNLTGTPSGSGHVTANQSAFFSPGSINFSGGSAGGWDTSPAEHYDAKSHLRWKVRANQCMDYTLYMTIDPGTPVNSAYVDVSGPGGTLFHLASGTLNAAGRLPSGDYTFEADVPLSSTAENGSGGTYNLIWQCFTCETSLISVHPADLIVPCDTIATFCVVPNGQASSFTYQWRLNYVPLTNTAHYSGVNTPCLSIHDVCTGDYGYFDVVVTSGATSEASRGAHVAIGMVGVGEPPVAEVGWTLGAATPSPSRESSSFHYAAPAPFRARASIHDAAGRVVRQLAAGDFEASGSFAWDGRTTAGSPAVPGIYFLRFERAGKVDVRRIVRVR